jgi:hypothetical protein
MNGLSRPTEYLKALVFAEKATPERIPNIRANTTNFFIIFTPFIN